MNRPLQRAVQQRLPIDDDKVRVRALLISVGVVTAARSVTKEEVMAAIQETAIRWAFDISSPGASHPYVRIYRPSFQEWERGIKNMDGKEALDAVLKTIFPDSRPVWTAAKFARALSCERDHTVRLVQAGALQKLQKNYEINESPLIRREDIIAFMKSRVMVA